MTFLTRNVYYPNADDSEISTSDLLNSVNLLTSVGSIIHRKTYVLFGFASGVLLRKVVSVKSISKYLTHCKKNFALPCPVLISLCPDNFSSSTTLYFRSCFSCGGYALSKEQFQLRSCCCENWQEKKTMYIEKVNPVCRVNLEWITCSQS